jgi:hypothetical protein
MNPPPQRSADLKGGIIGLGVLVVGALLCLIPALLLVTLLGY